MKKYYIIVFVTVTGAIVALSSHIYILKYTSPLLAKLSNGHNFITPDDYSSLVIYLAYLTAIEQTSVIAILYYFIGGLLPIKKIYKTLVLSFVYLEINGSLIRVTIMDSAVAYQAGISNPILYGILSQIDKWISGLLLTIMLVYLCPTKKYSNKNI